MLQTREMIDFIALLPLEFVRSCCILIIENTTMWPFRRNIRLLFVKCGWKRIVSSAPCLPEPLQPLQLHSNEYFSCNLAAHDHRNLSYWVPISNQITLRILSGNKGVKTVLETVLRSTIASVVLEQWCDKNVSSRRHSELHEPQKIVDWDTKIESDHSKNSFR